MANYVPRGGKIEDTVGRKCLCNALNATAGYPQQREDGYVEPPMVTAGDDIATVPQLVREDRCGYSAADVIRHILGTTVTPPNSAPAPN